jgi:hypothetical protein
VTDWIERMTELARTYQFEAWTIGSVALLAVLGVIVYEVASRVRGASRGMKELVGYGVVQIGMAYVTITGGYDFWHHIAKMPTFEAAAVSVIVEASQWWFIARVFRHMAGKRPDGTPNIGYGPAGPKFWASVFGGGIIAVAGAFAPGGGLSLAIGRAVVVYIGASMWDLLLKEKVHTAGTAAKATFLITPRRLAVMLGIMSAEDRDLRSDSREWTIRRMTRAIRWRNSKTRPLSWLGTRTLLKAMDLGDETLMAEATARYARGWVLTHEVNATSASMLQAIEAARRVLTLVPAPQGETGQPGAPPVQEETTRAVAAPPAPVVAERPEPIPVRRPRLDQPKPKRPPTAETEDLREQARVWAMTQMRAGKDVTAKDVQSVFGHGPEWARQRRNEARRRLEEEVVHGASDALAERAEPVA